jgi:hypothetical protein
LPNFGNTEKSLSAGQNSNRLVFYEIKQNVKIFLQIRRELWKSFLAHIIFWGENEFKIYVILIMLPQGSHKFEKFTKDQPQETRNSEKCNDLFTKDLSHFEIPLFIIHSFYFTTFLVPRDSRNSSEQRPSSTILKEQVNSMPNKSRN